MLSHANYLLLYGDEYFVYAMASLFMPHNDGQWCVLFRGYFDELNILYIFSNLRMSGYHFVST